MLTRRWRTPCLAAVLAALVVPCPAQAGSYDVHACDAGIAGGANNSFSALADAGMTAYASCPAGQGMVARSVWDGGHTGALQGAWMIFDAPPGNLVESVDFEAGWERRDCNYTVGIVASQGDLGGNVVWGYPAGQQCGQAEIPSDTDFFPARLSAPVYATRVRIESRCGLVAFCTRDGLSSMRLKDVTVHVRDDVAPVLQNGRGAMWTSSGWLAGRQGVGFDATDSSGIRDARILVDGKPAALHSYPCDYTLRAPCGTATLDEVFSTQSLDGDGDHTVTLQATDAGGNVTEAARTVHIDNTPPDPPQSLGVAGGDGWRPSNGFDLSWTDVPQRFAPITGAVYKLCPSSGGTCTSGSADGAAIASLKGLKLPAPGEYALTLWLRDAAGNQDERLAAPPVVMRYDDASPTAAFEHLSADDPTRLSVITSDRGSGVVSGQIEVHRQGTEVWQPMPTSVQGDRLVAHIDDEHLADGVYELRARAADRAGNERVTQEWDTGGPATVALPLRLKTALRAGVVRRHGRRTRLARRASVGYGTLVRVRGRLLSPEGNPIQGVAVHAYTQIQDGVTPPRLIATVTTSRTGRFSFLVRRGPTRKITLRYEGAPQVRGATRELLLEVRSRTSIRPNRHRVGNGASVRFRGRIRTGRIPSQGKLVELQVYVRKRWRTFATTRASRRGRWHYDYRFDGTKGTQSYRFRAKIPREAGYPFATGRSRVVFVRVRGA